MPPADVSAPAMEEKTPDRTKPPPIALVLLSLFTGSLIFALKKGFFKDVFGTVREKLSQTDDDGTDGDDSDEDDDQKDDRSPSIGCDSESEKEVKIKVDALFESVNTP